MAQLYQNMLEAEEDHAYFVAYLRRRLLYEMPVSKLGFSVLDLRDIAAHVSGTLLAIVAYQRHLVRQVRRRWRRLYLPVNGNK